MTNNSLLPQERDHSFLACSVSSSILRTSKVLHLSRGNRNYALFSGSTTSILLDLGNGNIHKRTTVPPSPGGASANTAVVKDRYLVTIAIGICQCYDILRKQQLFFGKPQQVGIKTEASTLIPTPPGRLYVIGGKNTSTQYCTSTVEYFDLTRSALGWRYHRPLKTPRRCAGGVALRSSSSSASFTVVVVGGQHQNNDRHQFEDCASTEFLMETGDWSEGPNLHTARRNPCVITIHGTVLVLGGRNGDSVVETIEAWRPGTDRFVVVGRVACEGRDISALAVGSSVYVFQEGEIRVIIKKLPFFPSELLPEVLGARSIGAPTTTVESGLSSNASVVANDTEAEGNVLLSSSEVIKRNDPVSSTAHSPRALPSSSSIRTTPLAVPEPPIRPTLPLSFTLHDRSRALTDYIQNLHQLQEIYSKTIENAVEQRIAACKQEIESLQKRVNQEIEMLQSHAQVWTANNQRLIQNAKEEIQHQQVSFKQQQATFVEKTLHQHDQDDFADAVPSQLRCPITLQLMTDPVVAADGNAYERSALESWLARSKKSKQRTSPLTGAPLDSDAMFSVHTLKGLCQEFSAQQKAKRKQKCKSEKREPSSGGTVPVFENGQNPMVMSDRNILEARKALRP